MKIILLTAALFTMQVMAAQSQKPSNKGGITYREYNKPARAQQDTISNTESAALPGILGREIVHSTLEPATSALSNKKEKKSRRRNRL